LNHKQRPHYPDLIFLNFGSKYKKSLALFMAKEIIIALIAAFTSLVTSFYQVVQGRRNQQDLEVVKLKLAEQQAERGSRRDYEYNALQRLYEEYEPIRFQLIDSVESAKYHIEELQQEMIWRQGVQGLDLLLSTVYHLLLSSAVYRLARRSLTLVDLKVDPQIELQYLLVKKVYLAFTHDRQIAKFSGLDYTPFVEGWREKRIENPQKYKRQGLTLGRLDNAVDALLIPLTSSPERERVVSFGEFEQQFSEIQEEDVRGALRKARDLFYEFHPSRQPVLWQILLTQYCLYKAILALANGDNFKVDLLAYPDQWLTSEELHKLQWEIPKDSLNEQNLEYILGGIGRYLREMVVPDVIRILQK